MSFVESRIVNSPEDSCRRLRGVQRGAMTSRCDDVRLNVYAPIPKNARGARSTSGAGECRARLGVRRQIFHGSAAGWKVIRPQSQALSAAHLQHRSCSPNSFHPENKKVLIGQEGVFFCQTESGLLYLMNQVLACDLHLHRRANRQVPLLEVNHH
jgi:hypothetical protein